MVEMLVVTSKVKEMIKGKDMNTAGDAVEGLNAVVVKKVDKAIERAKANGRKTVRPEDF
jgi:histone H3/H4